MPSKKEKKEKKKERELYQCIRIAVMAYIKNKNKIKHIVALSNHQDSLLETIGTYTGIFQTADVAHLGLLSHLLACD